jgi:hypothetical protein
MVVTYNPVDEQLEQTLTLPLYYAGLTDEVRVREKEGEPRTYKLDREYQLHLLVKVPARGVDWFVMTAAQ